MTAKLSPAIKGLITAILMIAASLYIYANKNTIDARAQYLVYALYAVGIIWAITAFAPSAEGAGRFRDFFSQGFKCFIVVTLVMVILTHIFIKTHPEYAEAEAKSTKEYYQKEGNKLPAEIDDLAAQAKKHYALAYISVSIFGYLIFGTVVSAITAFVVNRRK